MSKVDLIGTHTKLTIPACKKIVKKYLDEHGIPYTKLTGRTINFIDLARATCVFIKIHGWEGKHSLKELQGIAVENGFRVETDWFIS